MDWVKAQPNDCFSPINDSIIRKDHSRKFKSNHRVGELSSDQLSALAKAAGVSISLVGCSMTVGKCKTKWTSEKDERGKVKGKSRELTECQSMLHQLSTGNNLV